MKNLTIIFIAVLAFSVSKAQDITGEWNGMLKFQGKQLRIVFHIVQTDTGLVSTMDSPDQGAKGIPVTSTSFEDATLSLIIASAKITYNGEMDDQQMIRGTFVQAGFSFPLDLTREKIEKEIKPRPQDPGKPYPYYSEDVTFENAEAKVKLAGTLTLPAKEGNYPAVILITGSGPQNRDEELLGHRPFLVLADHLTKNGIAVLRFDDRGTGESTGEFSKATTEDFAADVESAFNYLKTRKEIDSAKIGLMGHSEGGIIAPMVAANNLEVKFIVLLAGTGIPGSKLLLLQQELIGRAKGVSESDLEKTRTLNQEAFDIVVNNENRDSIEAKLRAFIVKSFEEFPAEEQPENPEEVIEQQMQVLLSPWMMFFLKHDPAPVLKNVKCPVLALNGEKDLQVPPKINLDAISNALAQGKNKSVTTKILPGMNHLFQECETGSPDEYEKIEQTFSPVALAEIAIWITGQVK
ncbi:MAG: alpha/beta hydrolase [Bacteroidetes bacterium]|nr:alpha/beta hydrolase [Bacteroidota bacterium]